MRQVTWQYNPEWGRFINISKKTIVNAGKAIAKNMGTAYIGDIAKELSKSKKLVFNRQMERAGKYIFIPSSKTAKAVGSGLALYGVVETIASISNNFRYSKSWQEALGK